MNFAKIALAAKLAAKHGVNFCKRHLPQIMTGIGVGGFVATAFVSGKAAIKTKDILKEKDEKLYQIESERGNPGYSEEDYQNDKKIVRTQTAVKVVKAVALPVTLGVASAASIFWGQSIMGRRAATALAGAYEAQKKLYDYDRNVVNAFGEETAQKLRSGLAIDKLEESGKLQKKAEEEQNKPPEHTVAEDGDEWIDVPFWYDAGTCRCGGWRESPYERLLYIRDVWISSCERLRINGHLSINEILWTEFNHPSVSNGEYGWICDPKGLGIDVMEWTVNAGYGDIDIHEFTDPNKGFGDYLQKGDDDIQIRFKVKKKNISRLYDQINCRHRANV